MSYRFSVRRIDFQKILRDFRFLKKNENFESDQTCLISKNKSLFKSKDFSEKL
jgi:hypothetical protein